MRTSTSKFFRSRSTAFSLVELSLTMAIMVTLAGIAIPRYARSMAVYRATAAAKRIVNDIQLAQTSAMSSSASQTITFGTQLDGYAITGTADLETAANVYTVRLGDDPYLASINTLTLGNGGGSTITFDGFGKADRGATIVVKSGSELKTIVFDALSGRAVIQ